MSGPIEPYRSRSLSKRAVEREQRAAMQRLAARSRCIRTARNLPDGLRLPYVEPRETRPRDRSLNGKARIAARRAERRAS